MPIEIAPYDPAWGEEFEREAKRLRAALGPLAQSVDHIGSTAVTGLAAKAVIDIQVSAPGLGSLDAYRERLEGLGYSYTSEPFPYFHRPAHWPHTHHVHVREAGSVDAHRTLAFRDWLRAHPEDRNAYERLKRELAADADSSTAQGRFRYSDAKTRFVRAVEDRALRARAQPLGLRLRDGRQLAYAEYGEPTAPALLLFQGTPSSRLPHQPLSSRVPVRLVVPERPGFGHSDFQLRRRLLDWPDDVGQLADHLELERFSVLGISGGGPHALVCGARLGARVERVGVVSGLGPPDAPRVLAGMAGQRQLGLLVARHAPFLLRPLLWALSNPARHPERFLERFTRGFPAPDRALLADPELRALRMRSYAEATRQGVRGFAQEIAILTRPWGFALAEVSAPVVLWHGVADTSTPVGMARQVASSLARCETRLLPGEGHLVAARHWEEIVAALCPTGGPARPGAGGVPRPARDAVGSLP